MSSGLIAAIRISLVAALVGSALSDDLVATAAASPTVGSVRTYVYDSPSASTTPPANTRTSALFIYDAVELAGSRATKGGSTALKETRTGLGFTGHGADRLAKRGVRTPDALDAWRNPLQRGPVVVDERGRPGQKLIGRNATIVVNTETNKIVTGYATGRRTREQLLGEAGGG